MRDQRLTGRRNLQRVRDARRRVNEGAVSMAGCANGLGHSRVALATPKIRPAVRRNRIRRRLRHALRAPLTGTPGLDLVVTAREQCATVDYPTLCGWVERAVGRLRVVVG